MSEQQNSVESKKEEVIFHTPWKDYKDDPPMIGQVCIGLFKEGMCFFVHGGNNKDPLNVMKGLFYVPSSGVIAGLRFAIEDISHWVPLPTAYMNE